MCDLYPAQLLPGRRRHHGLLGTAAGEDVGLKELPDRESVREVLAGGHEPFEVDEGAPRAERRLDKQPFR